MSTRLRLSLEEFARRLRRGDGRLPLPEMLVLLESDPAERIVIDELAAVLRRDGSFRDPIVLLCEEEGDVTIADGRHRAAAHLRTGIGPVEVRFGYEDVDEDAVLVRVTYELTGTAGDGMPLRSLSVGDGWATADVCSTLSTDGTFVTYTYWAPAATPQAVGEAGVRRAAALGFTARVLALDVEPLRD
ncbi:MAG: ParB N-terminal domain-containing protein [Acidobacteria bacterium]|nr:ParB N-terminal domain-containing protein [Acidobacteriota bacterium]